MFKRIFLVGALLVPLVLLGCDRSPDAQGGGRLINGKTISAAEHRQAVGSLPMNMIATPDGRFALTTDMGYKEAVWVIGTGDGRGVSRVAFSNKGKSEGAPEDAGSSGEATGSEGATSKAAAAAAKTNGLYYGLAAAADGTVFAAQGAHDSIAVLAMDPDGKLTPKGEIRTKKLDFPAGVALDGRGLLFVANNTAGGENPLRSPGSVAIYQTMGAGPSPGGATGNPDSGKEIGRCELPDRFHGTSGFPLAICVLRDGSKAYVDAERDGAVYVIGASDPAHPRNLATIDTGAEPVGMCLSRDDRLLFVACAQSESVSIIDTASDRQIATVLVRPEQARGLRGASPVAVTLAPDQKTLYVALADMNAVAVVNVSDAAMPVLQGYLPTGWYPSAVIASPDGRRLLVADAKGSTARNPNGHLPAEKAADNGGYVLNLLEGDVRTITIPDADGLRAATQQVLGQNDLPAPERAADRHVAAVGLAAHKIEHVFYIIKENRTYDQVLGDLPRGNGDPSLTLFGRGITPNLHALAERFVLLDNTYCCGDVSGDGWEWSTQGMANPYVERNVPYNYSKRGRKFDFEGQNNGLPTGGVPATGPDAPATTNPIFSQGGEAMPDVASSGDHLWDAAKRAGVSLRNYGFFLSFADTNAGVVGGPENYPTVPGLDPGGHDLAGVSDLDYRRFDLDFADSDAPQRLFEKTGNAHCLYETKTYGNARAASRYSEWKREFDMMLVRDPSGGSVPALTMLRLGNDHTSGMKAEKHSPRSMVADNDYAVGEVVDAISHSAIWKSSAIVVIEDDAQSGEDHVDAHRTTCFMISPWIKKNAVDHRFYNTDSVLKTMELLLGIGPMTQYEAIAAPMDDWDASPNNAAPFDAIFPPESLIAEINPKARDLATDDPRRALVELSDRMDFTRADAAPTPLLNEVVWKSIHGTASQPPAVRVSNTLPKVREDDDDDDDGDGN